MNVLGAGAHSPKIENFLWNFNSRRTGGLRRGDLLVRLICLHRGTLLLFGHVTRTIGSMRTTRENEK